MTRSVLVTGSSDSRGSLGFTVASVLAQPPHDFTTIILSGRSLKAVEGCRDNLQTKLDKDKKNVQVAALRLDVSDANSIHQAFQWLRDRSGPLRGEPLDVLINNAGLGSPPNRSKGKNQQGGGASGMFLETEETTIQDVLSVMTVNVAGVSELTSESFCFFFFFFFFF